MMSPRISNDIYVTVGAKQPRNLKELFAIRAIHIRRMLHSSS
jgi:hypothetical protein